MAVPSQEIVVTALPAGRSSESPDQLKLTLLFSPRLVSAPGDESLGAFPDWADWPALASSLQPTLWVDGGPRARLEPAFGADKPSSELWKRLFPKSTYVRPYAFDKLLGRRIRSFPFSRVSKFLADFYGDLAGDPAGEMPTLNQLGSRLGALGRLQHPQNFESRDKLLGEHFGVNGTLPSPENAPSGFGSAEEYAFFQNMRFYKRPKPAGANPYKRQPEPGFQSAPIEAPRLDFHQGVSAIGDFPRLMRRFGIAVDYVFAKPDNFPTKGTLSVDPGWPDGFPQSEGHVDRTPLLTEYTLEGEYFGPSTGAQSAYQLGYLDLRGASDARFKEVETKFSLSQVDVDGGSMKTMDFAGSLSRRTQFANYRSPERLAAPSLRTSGISVIRNGRDKSLEDRLVASDKHNDRFSKGKDVALDGEDLVRGYRVDVLDTSDGSGEWRTLCARVGRYIFESAQGNFQIDLDDEGYVKSASTTGEKDGSTDLYLHERVFSFEGWSLVASRPGKALPKDPSDEPVEPSNVSGDLPLVTRFRPEAGTLPRLRFGRKYRLRARLVDLAGNSLPLRDGNMAYVSEELHYLRYEPVASPTVVPLEIFAEGESLERMVIRSDYDRTASQYASDPEVVAALSGWQHTYRDYNDRHLAPPKTSQQESELHGMFDTYIGEGKDPQAGFYLASRESGTLFDTNIVNLNTGVKEPIPSAELKLFTPTGAVPTDLSTLKPGDPLQEGEYIMRGEDHLIIPYLPDPLAKGVALTNLPGDPDGLHLVEFGGAWPDAQPLRIRIAERPGLLEDCRQVFPQEAEPEWNAEQRLLTVYMEKGQVAEVKFSCFVDREDFELLGLAKWHAGSPAQLEALSEKAQLGAHWMMTPWRTLTLAHAVQRPLCPPRWLKLTATKAKIGDTFARLRGTIRESARTTGQLDFYAKWTEWLDELSEPGPGTVEKESHVVQRLVEPHWPRDHPMPNASAGANKPDPLIHEFGDTKHRIIEYRLKGTTRFREYLPPAINKFDAKISRTGEGFEVIVRNSARPKAPSVVDILPAFEWSESAVEGGGIRRTRKGNALRVYLDRPWYSSGEGEQLGVVYSTGRSVSARDEPFVTQWGKDPMFAGSNPSVQVAAKRFTSKISSRAGLTLKELGTSSGFGVAGHQVHYDTERRLWYSDIELDCGSSYFPFVRLALARYQPESIANAHLSPIAQTEFSQLVPDRTSLLTPKGRGVYAFSVHGVAPTETYLSKNYGHSAAAAATLGSAMQAGRSAVPPFKKPGLNRYEVSVEYLREGASPDFGWLPYAGVSIRKPGRKRPVLTKRPTARPAAKLTRASGLRFKRIVSANTSRNIGNVSVNAGIETFKDIGKLLKPLPLWSGEIAIEPTPPKTRLRLVIEEFELYLKEADDRSPAKRTAEKRLVYADIFPL